MKSRSQPSLSGDTASRVTRAESTMSRAPPISETVWKRMSTRRDPRTMIGLSDAGAHLDMLCESGYTTWLLGHWVREEKALSLERAIQRITSEPADFFGLKDRGRLQVGAAADIVVFDPQRVSSPLRPTPVKDLPAGGARLYCKAEGISRVIVNGETLYLEGKPTAARPGKVLRSV